MVALALALTACAERRARPSDAGACEGADCGAGRVHAPGILDPADPAFHGRVLADHGWDLGVCAGCHGADLGGTTAAPTCLGCHAAGPATCATCHGVTGSAPAASGAHAPHLAAGVPCAACHLVPATWAAPGHVLDDAPPADVTFGALASVTPPGAVRAGPPAWDGRRCANVYCHGDVTPAWGGRATAPRWSAAPVAFTCDRCHGAPPPDHVRVDCVACHPLAPATHVDGVVQVHGAP